jgi:hypothetical protein
LKASRPTKVQDLVDYRRSYHIYSDIDPESDDDEGTEEGYLAGSFRWDNLMRMIIDKYIVRPGVFHTIHSAI